MILKWRKRLTLLKQMSSQLKPANPISLKWATNSQHTREFQMSHVCYLFPPVSCSILRHRPPLHVMTSWKVRITLSQSLGDAGHGMPNHRMVFQLWKAMKYFFLLFNVSVQLWLQPCPCAPTWFNPPTLGNARCVTGLLYASPNNTHPHVSIHQPYLYQTYKTHIKLFNANNLCSKNLFLCFKQKLWSRCWKGLPAILGNQKFTRRLRKPLDLSGQICKDRKNIRYKISL